MRIAATSRRGSVVNSNTHTALELIDRIGRAIARDDVIDLADADAALRQCEGVLREAGEDLTRVCRLRSIMADLREELAMLRPTAKA